MDPELHRLALTQAARLQALKRTELLDSLPEPSFERFTRMAARLTSSPTALVSLVDDNRQFFKSALGLGEPWASERQTPLTHSFCQYVAASGRPLVVEDAREHELVKDNLAVSELGVLSYLGIPLWAEGKCIGSLCVLESQPRRWSEEDQQALRDLAATVNAEIELRLTTTFAERLTQLMPAVIYVYDRSQDRLTFYNELATLYNLNPLWIEPVDGEVCLTSKKSQQTRWFLHRCIMLDTDGNLQLGVATDIDESKRQLLSQLEQELRGSADVAEALARVRQSLQAAG
ncbi:hypothetical protein ABS71_11695 [bacterium SCN 62-11]|nr:GAF domain-containing protein [Candidatus Eremiobacteraeota bacterium]ODT66405.1 MAG: hypothetical protein ABS71_11695 [bacterium SCN 62-11]